MDSASGSSSPVDSDLEKECDDKFDCEEIQESRQWATKKGVPNYFPDKGSYRTKAQELGVEDGNALHLGARVSGIGFKQAMGRDIRRFSSSGRLAEQLGTAEHLSGASMMMIRHIFDELDTSQNGLLGLGEFQLLGIEIGQDWSIDETREMFKDVGGTTDPEGRITFYEFYSWFIHNVKVTGDNIFEKRHKPLNMSEIQVEPKLYKLLMGTCMDIPQEDPERPAETHKDKFGCGRYLRDHLVSCYRIAKTWDFSKDLQLACLAHAIYEPGFHFRLLELHTARPFLQYIVGEHVESLLYNFIGGSRSIFNPDGLYHAPIGGDYISHDFDTGETVKICDLNYRKDIVAMEFVNNYDKMSLREERDPIKSMWLYYQHCNVKELLPKQAQEVVERYKVRGQDATCADIVKWHEERYEGKVPPMWQNHIKMFQKGGQYYLMENPSNDK